MSIKISTARPHDAYSSPQFRLLKFLLVIAPAIHSMPGGTFVEVLTKCRVQYLSRDEVRGIADRDAIGIRRVYVFADFDFGAVFQMRFLTDIVSPYALRIAPVIG